MKMLLNSLINRKFLCIKELFIVIINFNLFMLYRKSIENIFRKFLYDGPGKLPIIGQVQFFNQIYNSKKNEENIVETLRQLRSDFCVNISERMV